MWFFPTEFVGVLQYLKCEYGGVHYLELWQKLFEISQICNNAKNNERVIFLSSACLYVGQSSV